jgi:hypothetical protein
LVDVKVGHASRKRLVANGKPDEAKALGAFKAHQMPVLIGEIREHSTAPGIYFEDTGMNRLPLGEGTIDGNESSGAHW